MNNTNEEIISSLKDKIKRLISLYEACKLHNNELAGQNKKLKQELSEYKSKLADNQLQLDTLKLAKAVSVTSEDSHEAKIKINRIVREIDKCIALMNK